MIDLILIVFCLGVWYAGFWCGKKYGTLDNMFTDIKRIIKEKLA